MSSCVASETSRLHGHCQSQSPPLPPVEGYALLINGDVDRGARCFECWHNRCGQAYLARFDSPHLRDSRGRAGKYSTVIEVVVVIVMKSLLGNRC